MVDPKSSYDRDDLIKSGKGELFGPEYARLPLPNMLMIDRIKSITKDGGKHGKGEVVAELDIDPELWFFKCHFEGDPVMPGCLGLDALWQLVGFYITWRGNVGKGRALGVGEVKFTGQVLPTAKLLTYKLSISRLLESRLKLAVADGEVMVDGKTIYTARNLKVGLFTETDNF